MLQTLIAELLAIRAWKVFDCSSDIERQAVLHRTIRTTEILRAIQRDRLKKLNARFLPRYGM